MFVLVMQVLWLYIDDIAGKGLGLFLILELMGYKSLSLVPMALPLAILISSVMVLGNMGERYELSSFKSAGVSLWRIMIPDHVLWRRYHYMFSRFSVPTTSFRWPTSSLAPACTTFRSRSRRCAWKPGIFNDDFDGYAIHIGQQRRGRQAH